MPVLRLFAAAREAAGVARAELDGATVGAILEKAEQQFGARFAGVLAHSRVWVNGQPAQADTAVRGHDVVAVLPPVSGGSDADAPWGVKAASPAAVPDEPTIAVGLLERELSATTGQSVPINRSEPDPRPRPASAAGRPAAVRPPSAADRPAADDDFAYPEYLSDAHTADWLADDPEPLAPPERPAAPEPMAKPAQSPRPASPEVPVSGPSSMTFSPSEPPPAPPPRPPLRDVESLLEPRAPVALPDLPPPPTEEPKEPLDPLPRAFRPLMARLAVVYDSKGPHGRLGLLWAIVTVGAAVAGAEFLAGWLGLTAFVGACQAGSARRNQGHRPVTVLAAVIAVVIPAAAVFGVVYAAAAVGAAAVVSFGTTIVLPNGSPARDGAETLGIGVTLGLAAAAPVVLRVDHIEAAILLLAYAAVYDAGAYLVGTGASSVWEGPAAGMAALIPVVILSAVLLVPPFESGTPILLGLLAAVLAPLGPLVGSWVVGDGTVHAPGLRRLDSLIVLGPLWAAAAVVFIA